MSNENPLAKKLVKGQNRSTGTGLPRIFNRIPVQSNTYPNLGEEITEPSTRRRFLQGIPITRETISSGQTFQSFLEVRNVNPTVLERELHANDINSGRRSQLSPEGAVYEIPFLIDRIDPNYSLARTDNWHPTIIADNAGYFPEGFISNLLQTTVSKKDRVDAICRYVSENVIEQLQGSDNGQILGNQNYFRFYEQLAFLCSNNLEDNSCLALEEMIKSYLDRGYVLELVAEGRLSSGGGNYDGPLLTSLVTGSITNFALQTPVAIDDCAVEDLYSNIAANIETATAKSIYQLYVDPLNEQTLRFPTGSSLTDWPARDYTNYIDYWDVALEHERNLQVRSRTTYYGNLDSKNKDGFPRYAGLSIPTYQASSFVNLFNNLDAERRIYPHIVGHMGDPDEYDSNSYHMEWQFYHTEDGWKDLSASFILKQTPLTRHFRHLQRLTESEPDIFDVVEDQTAQAEQIEQLGIDIPDLINPQDFNLQSCPPFMDRIRAMLAEESAENLLQDIIDDQFNSQYGLFLGMINQDLQYTEPLFYKIERERIVPEGSPLGDVGHLMVRSGVPILGAQPIFHANKAENSYFTFEDRFVDYGDTYQYNIDTYAVVMRVDYEANPLAQGQVRCFVGLDTDQIEQKLGEGVNYSLVAFMPSFDVLKIPYVHRNYTDLQGEPPEMSSERLAVALPPVTILDNPPIPPGVNIVPYRGVADKMLIMFDLQTDKIIDQYIHLTDAEKINFENVYRRQKKVICDLCENSVEFASEGGDIQRIQIFRTTTVPAVVSEQNPSQLYRDAFGSEPHREIDATQGSAFVDDIEPNTKYFYMFRATDKNGHVSNPSHIYRVEMVEEDGLIFPIIELYTPQEKKRGVKYRKMAKHLEIKPSLLMVEPNWSADDDNNISWKVGAREENIFGHIGANNGRKFLIRLTSIDTGRKIDIKVRFGKETNKVEATEDRDLGE